MGKNFTKEQKETYLQYQPLINEACVKSAKFEEIATKLQIDVSSLKK